MIQFIESLINRLPYIRKKQILIEKLRDQLAEEKQQVGEHGLYPVGHYNSPIPARDDVLSYTERTKRNSLDLPDIGLNYEGQLQLLHELSRYYHELPFPERKTQDQRYFYENNWFSYGDAIILSCFLRKYAPRRIIEVGSGFSTAVMLDTADIFLEREPAMTLVEPYPDRLRQLLRSDDLDRVTIIEQRVQDVPLELFRSLGAGDLLFIDSSHVVKCGSDLQHLFFEVLSLLPAGVFVHFHDVFFPFDYPDEWLKKGIYYNENYFLRAFLSCNSQWKVIFFNSYASMAFTDQLRQKMPLCLKNPGGGLYLRRE